MLSKRRAFFPRRRREFAFFERQTGGAGEETKGIAAMPNPKRRHSSRRTANRRAHDFLTASKLSECPNCHEKKLPHRACPKCGVYRGRAVLEVKEAAK
jgi:large subunit ribosomal protein L32